MAISPQEAKEKAKIVCDYIAGNAYSVLGRLTQSQEDTNEFLEKIGLTKRPDGLFTLYSQPMIGREVLVDPAEVYSKNQLTHRTGFPYYHGVFLYKEANGDTDIFDSKEIEKFIKRCNRFEVKMQNGEISVLKLRAQIKPGDSEARLTVVSQNVYTRDSCEAPLPTQGIDFSSCDFHEILLNAGLAKEVPIPDDIMELWDEHRMMFKGMKHQDLEAFPRGARPMPMRGVVSIASTIPGSESECEDLIDGALTGSFAYVIVDNAGRATLWQIMTR